MNEWYRVKECKKQGARGATREHNNLFLLFFAPHVLHNYNQNTEKWQVAFIATFFRISTAGRFFEILKNSAFLLLSSQETWKWLINSQNS